MNLATTYMGMSLPTPMIVGSSPLTDDLDLVKRLEDAGASALVLPSLYEEEIKGEQIAAFLHSESHGDSSAEAGERARDRGVSAEQDRALDDAVPKAMSVRGVQASGVARLG